MVLSGIPKPLRYRASIVGPNLSEIECKLVTFNRTPRLPRVKMENHIWGLFNPNCGYKNLISTHSERVRHSSKDKSIFRI